MKTYDLSLITKKILESDLNMYDLHSFSQLLDIRSPSSIFRIINRLIKSEVIFKIEKNKYLVNNNKISIFALANQIYQPCYISFESALNYYSILSQFPYEITSATPKQTKKKVINKQNYGFYHIKKELYFGFAKIKDFLIAEKEKALLDQIYLFSKGVKKIYIDEYDLTNINKSKIKKYSVEFPKSQIFSKIVNQII